MWQHLPGHVLTSLHSLGRSCLRSGYAAHSITTFILAGMPVQLGRYVDSGNFCSARFGLALLS